MGKICAGILTAIFLSTITLQAQPPAWTLSRCIDEALKNSARLDMSRQTAVAAEAAWRESRAALWPSLGVGGNYNYASETQSLDFPAFMPGAKPTHVSFGDGNVYDFAATAKVPLYSGGSISEKSRADQAAWQASRFDAATDSLRLLYDVRRAYFNALGARERENAARASVARLQRHYDEIAGSKTIGTASEENRVFAEARLRQAEGLLLNAHAETQTAELTLGNLIGQPSQAILPEGDLGTELFGGADTSSVAMEQRKEIAALNARLMQSDHLTRAAKGSLLPALSGVAAYHYGKPGVNPVKNDWMNYYTVGLSASWSLWDWNGRNSHIQQAQALRRAGEARKTDLTRALTTRLQTAQDALGLAKDARDKTTERNELERTRLTLVETRFKNGMATESELLDAQDDLTTAETDLATATVRVRLSEVELLYADGR